MKLHSPTTKLSTRELCLLALMGALMFALQLALSALPNIHLTAPFIILTAVFFGWKSLLSVFVFVMLEALIWGVGPWWLSYLYVWPLLAAVAVLMRKNRSTLIWAVLAAVHGLCFGALCAIPYLFVGGWEMAFSYWVSGIPFDLLHCGGNFLMTLILFAPMSKLMGHLLHPDYKT